MNLNLVGIFGAKVEQLFVAEIFQILVQRLT